MLRFCATVAFERYVMIRLSCNEARSVTCHLIIIIVDGNASDEGSTFRIIDDIQVFPNGLRYVVPVLMWLVLIVPVLGPLRVTPIPLLTPEPLVSLHAKFDVPFMFDIVGLQFLRPIIWDVPIDFPKLPSPKGKSDFSLLVPV